MGLCHQTNYNCINNYNNYKNYNNYNNYNNYKNYLKKGCKNLFFIVKNLGVNVFGVKN